MQEKKVTLEKPLGIILQILSEKLTKMRDLPCKSPRHTFSCGNKNDCLEEPFSKLNMSRLNKSNRLEIQKNYI